MFYSCKNGSGYLYVFADKLAAIYVEENIYEKLTMHIQVRDENMLIPVNCVYTYKNKVVTETYAEYIKIMGQFDMNLVDYPSRSLIRDYFGYDSYFATIGD